ncbi:MAG TPA: dihydrolipoyl dehydrogenase [Candidatus Dormibacteraeota bacterium]
MVVGEVSTFSEVVVIGGGPGGYATAERAAAMGKSVVLVERERLGGVCLNAGCIPSKALIQVANAVGLPAEAVAWGVEADARADMERVQAWMASVVDRLRGDVEGRVRRAGVSVVTGTARFSTARRVVVATNGSSQHIEFDHAVVASGSRPMTLRALAVDHVRILDSTDTLALRAIPGRTAVIGGGYIGLELGCALHKLGSAVTLVEIAERLLPAMHPALGGTLQRRLSARGIEVLLSTSALDDDGRSLCVRGPDGERRLEVDAVVVAVGRRPNTDELGLERAGVACDSAGRIAVDPSRRATRTVLAVGDVTDGPGLAHKATAEAEIAAATAAGRRAEFAPACIPEVVFTDPEVASAGLTPERAREAGAEVVTRRLPLTASARALLRGDGAGFVELVAEPGGALLGAHIIGPDAAELIAEAALAIEMGATLDDLALTIHPHPTLSESLATAAMS